MAKVSVGMRQGFMQAQSCQDLENSEGSTAQIQAQRGPSGPMSLAKAVLRKKLM